MEMDGKAHMIQNLVQRRIDTKSCTNKTFSTFVTRFNNEMHLQPLRLTTFVTTFVTEDFLENCDKICDNICDNIQMFSNLLEKCRNVVGNHARILCHKSCHKSLENLLSQKSSQML